MPRLRPVSDSPRRALGLVRVSKERSGMISPELQRAAIVDYAARRGYVITEWREGIDESGSRAKSAWWPRLNEAVEMVEARQVDVVLVWKYSRTARHRLRWAVALDRVETAGGAIESATEQIDTTTSTGRFTRGMLAEMAAFEAERIGDTWKEAHARRVRMGLPANGKPRFGYRVVAGRFEPDPETGPVLTAMYRRYVGGESIYSLVKWLNDHQYVTTPGYRPDGPGAWSQLTLRRVLDSGFGAGLITYQGVSHPGAHEPVIDADMWARYQASRTSRRVKRSSERSKYLLSGMLRCAAPLAHGPCGAPMGGGQFGHARQPKFRCIAAVNERRHSGGYVTMSTVEIEVKKWLAERATKIADRSAAVRERTKAVDVRRLDAAAVAREIIALDQQLTRLTLQFSREVIPEGAYVAARDEIELAKTELEVRHAKLVLMTQQEDAGPIAANLLGDWDFLTVSERRAMLRTLIARIEVTPARPRSTIVIVPAWVEGDVRS